MAVRHAVTVLLEVLLGEQAVYGKGGAEYEQKLDTVHQGKFSAPIDKDWNPHVQDMIRQCLQTDPAKRPSAEDALQLCRRWQASETASAWATPAEIKATTLQDAAQTAICSSSTKTTSPSLSAEHGFGGAAVGGVADAVAT